jgi:Domain of unknown function (DUF4157)
MRTIAQKPKATRRTTSIASTIYPVTLLRKSREVHSILHLQRTIGNQAVQRLLQANSHDRESARAVSPLEREADAAASAVAPARANVGGGAGSAASGPAAAPLHAADRSFMEASFGHDFSRVRVHADERAALRADALGAHAFTVGEDIFFSRGAYRPGDDGGRNLLAHELAHVVQQTGVRIGTHAGVLSRSLSRVPAGQVQPKLVATGDGAGFASIANTVIAVQFSVSVAANGDVALNSTNVQGPLTADAQELVSVLRSVIGNASTTTIRFTRGQTSTDPSDARVAIGSYPQSKIDLDDVLALGIHTSGYNAGAALAHEISEEFEKQVNKANFDPAHAAGLAVEARAVGATRIGDTSRVINSTTLELTFSYRYPDGRILDQVMTVTNGNVTNVVRTWRP